MLLLAATALSLASSLAEAQTRYTPPPAGTTFSLFNWRCEVMPADEPDTLQCRMPGGGNLKFYRGLVLTGSVPGNVYFVDAYQSDCVSRVRKRPNVVLPDAAKREIDKLWPLAVGKSASYSLEHAFGGGSFVVHVKERIAAQEKLEFGAQPDRKSYDTFVIERESVFQCPGRDGAFTFRQKIWYAPEYGLVTKEVTTWPHGSLSGKSHAYEMVNTQPPAAVAAATASTPTATPAAAPAAASYDGRWQARRDGARSAQAQIVGSSIEVKYLCDANREEITGSGSIDPDGRVSISTVQSISTLRVTGTFPNLSIDIITNNHRYPRHCMAGRLEFDRLDGSIQQASAPAGFDGTWTAADGMWTSTIKITGDTLTFQAQCAAGANLEATAKLPPDGKIRLFPDGGTLKVRPELSGTFPQLSLVGTPTCRNASLAFVRSAEVRTAAATPPAAVAPTPAAQRPATPQPAAPAAPAPAPVAAAPAAPAPAPAPPQDTMGPKIEIASTVTVEGGAIELAGRVTDDRSVSEVTVDDRVVAVDANGVFRVRRGVPSGKTALRVTARDDAGNRTEKEIKIVRVDATPPTIDAPANVTAKDNTVELAGRVTDESVLAEIMIDGQPVQFDKEGRFSLQRRLRGNEAELKIAAIDEWGNRTETAVAIIRPAAAPPPAPPPPKVVRVADGVHLGRYHALVIGNNNYKHLDKLKSAVNDAEAVTAQLTRQYGFKVTLMKDATRSEILRSLSALRRDLTPDDNLLIYYAGHGVMDEVTERGYWLPVDAEKDEPSNWVSNADITDMLRAIRAKHVMVVADSCYSGALTRSAPAKLSTQQERRAWIERVVKSRARTALASGGLEPVLDSGGGKHSVFAKAFLQALEENEDVLEGQALFEKIKRPVSLESDQTPRYSDIRQAGHDGGDFLFVRK